jgi:hypothetical protein
MGHRSLLGRGGRTLVLAGFVAMGCGSSSTGGTADGGIDSSTGATDGALDAGSLDSSEPDAGGACNTLANSAPVVMEKQVNTAAPTPAGGAGVDGTYFLTSATVYTGPQGATGPTGTAYQWTSKNTGSNYEVNYTIKATKTVTQVASGTSTISGAAVTFTQTCPALDAGASTTYGRDANGTTVTLYTQGAGDVVGYTFTKQ